MYHKKGFIRLAVVFGMSVLFIIGLGSLNPAWCAEQVYDVTPCVSMDIKPLVQSKEMTIVSFEAKGIMRSNIENKVFDNFTVHTQGVMLVEGQNTSVYCYMKYLAPDGDFVIFRYTQNPGEKEATTTLLAGTGKWKGIQGGGKAVLITQGKPVAPGTIQFCNTHKGKFTLPQ
jgi:hypothetical protein